MRELKVATDSFDRVNTFTVSLKGTRRTCSLRRDKKQKGDGLLWVMQHSGVIASSYSDEEIAERNRLNSETPLQDGDTVLVAGKQYRIKVIGDYSDLADLIAL